MVTKANGPTVADYKRLYRFTKWAGLPNIVLHSGKVTIVIPMDGTYLAKLPVGQPPAHSSEEEVKEVKTLW